MGMDGWMQQEATWTNARPAAIEKIQIKTIPRENCQSVPQKVKESFHLTG